MVTNEDTSPLFASSDRTVADGLGSSKRKNYGLGRSKNDEDASTASFPIKKIAFRPPATEENPRSNAASNNSDSEVNMDSSDQIRARQQKQEEFEALKREARAAGLRACNLAHMGIVPGVIYNDGETTKITCLAGSFGVPVKDVKKGEKKRKKAKKNGGKDIPQSQYDHHHAGDAFGSEEKEEINEDEDEDVSVPLTFETQTATTSPTEIDNATSASGGTKSSKSSRSSFFDPKRLFKKPHKKKAQKSNKKSPVQEALKEANDLLASGAWMCGVCGTPFDTSEHANRHEKVCLVEWLKHDKLVRQAWRDEQKPKNTSGVPIIFLESKQPLNYPEYLPPRTGGESPLSSPLVKKYLLMTDEALVSVARRQRHILHEVIDRDLCALSLKKHKAREDTSPASVDEYTDHDKKNHEDLFVWEREYDALRELELSSRDRHYYANLEQRAMERRFGHQPHLTHHDYYYHRLNRIRSAGSEKFDIDTSPDAKAKEEEEKEKFSLKKVIWGRLDNAYKLVKEGPTSPIDGMDNKRQTRKDDGDSGSNKGDMKHDPNTLYINVVVKNSVQMVNNELQRIARGWWQTDKGGEDQPDKEEILDFQFEWIRAHTQKRVIQLAGMALASDFTPRKVAVQLSKDLYRLMEPQLKPRGVTIQTVIEYREGQYFVLAVNILGIDWIPLMKWVAEQHVTNPNVALGQSRKDNSPGSSPGAKKKKKTMHDMVKTFLVEMRRRFPSRNEVVAYFLFFVYRRIHVFVAVPLLRICYFIFLRYGVNKFILNAVTDGE
mmetsp:Transcript_1092/g.1995  ORF Transcript_1092/g.1995 Transcript_1092/m.1995 type:complete len:776 (-) Transcript_1092:1102-3429(-)